MKKTLRRTMFVLVPCVISALFYFNSKRPRIIEIVNGERIYLSPDDKYLAVPNGYVAANLVGLSDGKHIVFKGTKEIDYRSDQEHKFILFTHDVGKVIIGESVYDRDDFEHLKGKHSISVWDVATRKKLRTITCRKPLSSVVVLFKNSRTLAYNDENGNIQLLDIESGIPMGSMPSRHISTPATSIALSPDGKLLLATYSLAESEGENRCGMILWDAMSRKILWTQGLIDKSLNFDAITAVFSPDSKTIALKGSDIQLRFFDVKSGHFIRSFNTATYPLEDDYLYSYIDAKQIVDFSPDGKLIATGGNQVDV